MFEQATMLFLYAETPSHVGSGESATVDLAIQRNQTTGWPIFQASSLKGSLRNAAPARNLDDAWKRTAAFGYDKADRRRLTEAEVSTLSVAEHASGALSVGDAALLAFPVASLAGVFAWIICPQAIREFQRAWARLPNFAGKVVNGFDPLTIQPPSLPNAVAVWLDGSAVELPAAGGAPAQVVLQEVVLNRLSGAAFAPATQALSAFAGWLADTALAGLPPLISGKLRKDLVLVSDDTFTSLVESGIHVITRVKIDEDSGTVAKSGPWDEELLPAETILYSPVMASEARLTTTGVPATVPQDAPSILTYFVDEVARTKGAPRHFQIGAGATVGWGFMAPAAVS